MVSDSYLAPFRRNIKNSQFWKRRWQKLVFGADAEYTTFTVISSILSENENHEFDAWERCPLKTSLFFARRKVITRLFRHKPNFQRKSAFWEAPPTKNPCFYRGISKKGAKNRRKNRERRHKWTRPNSTFAAFIFENLRFPWRARAEKLSEKRGGITGGREAATKHYKNRCFGTTTTPGPLSNPPRTHYRTYESQNPAPLPKPTAHIYIYICCGVIIWSKFGPFGSYYLVQVCFF